MWHVCLLILAASTVCCTRHPSPERARLNQPAAVITTPATSETNVAKKASEATKKEIPLEFRDVDFKNLTYPIVYTVDARRHNVELKDGTREYPFKQGGGGGANYELRDVDYVDISGDRKKEAVVWISQLICGGSCDGGSDFIYFYAAGQRKPKLLSYIELGSLAYDCGLKSFALTSRSLYVETFRACRFNKVQFLRINGRDDSGGKFMSNRSTKFWLRFDGTRFVQQSHEIVKYADMQNYINHEPKIEVK